MMVLDLRRGTQRKERVLEQFGADLVIPLPGIRWSVGSSQLGEAATSGPRRSPHPGLF